VLIPSLLLIFSLVLLYWGAEFSLEGSEKIGHRLGMSPLAIGMLLVGFGTSLPEFFVGHIAAVRGEPDIAFGSLIGSNIANMFLVLGVCGFVSSMSAQDKTLKVQLYIHLVLGGLLFFVFQQPVLNLLVASPLLLLCGFYLFMLYRDFRQQKATDKNIQRVKNMAPLVVKMISGFGMLYIGGELLVKSGTDLCTLLGIKPYIISAIFIAFGTSFPELVTSLIACWKGKDTNLVIGNIIGSNLFNCAFILGSLGIYEFKLESGYTTEIFSLVAGAAVLVLLAQMRRHFSRGAATVFLGIYTYMVGFWIGLF
jgi:cation:H+ antiporter